MPEIPEIQIPEIQIRAIPEPHVLPPPVTQNLAPGPIYEVPGCARVQDAHLNPSLLQDDPNGVGIACQRPAAQLHAIGLGSKKLQIIEPKPRKTSSKSNHQQGRKPSQNHHRRRSHRQR